MSTPWTTRVWQEFRIGNLSRSERDVLLTLHSYRGTGGRCWPSHATLAARAKCCVRTVQRALAAAQRLCLVHWCERRIRAGWRWLRTSNLYRFMVPDGPVQEAEARPVSRAPALPDITAGEGRESKKESKKEARDAVLRAAAAAPDLLAMRREAMARGLIGAGVAKAW